MKREDLIKIIISVLGKGGNDKKKTYTEIIKDLAVLVKDIIALISSMKENKSVEEVVSSYLTLKNTFLSDVIMEDDEA